MILRAFFLSALCLCAAPFARADVLVFAAASLKGPLDQIAANFDDVTVTYAGSGTIARQVSLGAPADVVLLANARWMQVLVDEDDVRPETVTDFASNRLVVVETAGATPLALAAESLQERLGAGRLAIGLTNAVPAGIYGKAALQSLNLWDGVKDQLAEVDNVRTALAFVARGQTPLGIVYGSDLHVGSDVVEVAMFPRASHPPIRYQGAMTAHATPQARAFLEFVAGPEGQAILQAAGFLEAVEVAQ